MSASALPPPGDLFVVSDTLAGGTGGLVRAQCAWFTDHGWHVTLVAPDDGPRPDDGVHFAQVPGVRSARRSREMMAARRALRAAWRAHADASTVVHVHGMRSFLLTRLAGLPKPYVSVHGAHPSGDDPRGYAALRRGWFRLLPRLARGATTGEPTPHRGWTYRPFVSPLLARIDALPFPPEGSPPTFVWLGLLDDRKQPEVFIRAVAAAGAPVRGLLAGDGPRSAELASLIAHTAAPVEMLGSVDPVPVLAQAWALCLFAKSEGTPLAVMEAMWAGRSVVGSDLPGVRYLVGDTGTLADDIDAAAAALRALAADHARAAELGAQAATRVRTLVTADTPWPEFARLYAS